jgi:hypothetical protein
MSRLPTRATWARPRRARATPASGQSGSIALFMLFVCLGVALLVQAVTVVVLCADHALGAEESGRARMDEADAALEDLRRGVLGHWGTMPWSLIQNSPEVEGRVSESADGDGWTLRASVRHEASLSPIVVSALLERGRDGVDLPLAGLVAGSADWTPAREGAWFTIGTDDSEGGGASWLTSPLVRLGTLPDSPLIGNGVSVVGLPRSWELDDGWLRFFELAGPEPGLLPSEPDPMGLGELALAAGVGAIRGDPGTTVHVPDGWGPEPGQPGLLVVSGGARLDAQNLGDIYGVLVVDDGGVLLDGTVIHGAVFVTGCVDFGASGSVVFAPPILRWATDRSLVRARLVPGTRTETTG